MKVSKAIEILKLYHDLSKPHSDPDLSNSIKLGIEALKHIQKSNATGQLRDRELLQGETPEDGTT